jgi:hypothetical protein
MLKFEIVRLLSLQENIFIVRDLQELASLIY